MEHSVEDSGLFGRTEVRLQGMIEKLEHLKAVLEELKQRAAAYRSLLHRGGKRSTILEAGEALDQTLAQLEQRLPAVEQGIQALLSEISLRLEEHRQLRALAEVSAVINSSLDLSEVLNRVIDKIIELTGAERAFLMLRDEGTGELQFMVARNMDRETISGSSFQISRTIVDRVAEEGEPIVTTNAQADPRFSAQESVVSYSLRSILCVPLRVKGRVIGVVYADNRIREGIFGTRDRDLLAAFANQAAVAIDNARLFESVVNAKKLMDNIFASITSGVVTTDEEDRITLINRAAERILNVSSDGCLGGLYTEALAPLNAVLPSWIDQVKRSDRPLSGLEAEVEIPGRGSVCLVASLSPLKDASDQTHGVALVLDDVTERRRFERQRAMIKRYLPPELVDSLPDDLSELRLGGKRQEISTLFADIRGFTTFSEGRNPEEVVHAVNCYFALAAEAVRTCKGIIDKYLGDAVMAHFNTPLLPLEDHALAAVQAAWSFQNAIREAYADLPPELHLQIGVGINTGEVVVGNVGAEEHMEYTPIGDAVNLAKRLQENAQGGQILIGSRTYELVKDFVEVVPLEPIRVKGRQAAEQVYEVTALRLS